MIVCSVFDVKELKKVEVEERAQITNIERIKSFSRVDWSFFFNFILPSRLFADFGFLMPLEILLDVGKADSPNNVRTFRDI